MKQIKLIIIVVLIQSKLILAQTFTDITLVNIPNMNHGSVNLGDYDNDGDLDILFNGTNDANEYITSVYKNTGNFTFEEIENNNFTGATSGSSEWGDYNNDGLLDFYVFGWVSVDNYILQIYKNEGGDQFTLLDLSELDGTRLGDAHWGDFDNDGDLDLFITGLYLSNEGYSSSSPRLFENTGNDDFVLVSGNSFIGVTNSSVDIGDYDKDGYVDIVYTGWTGNDIYGSVTKFYKNMGKNVFLDDTSINIEGMHSGSIEFGDYDQDGDLDVLLVGNRRINGSNIPSAQIFDNNNGNFAENENANLWVVDDGTAKWGDCDNDGDLDIVLTSGAYSSAHTYLYINNSDGSFTELKENETFLMGFDYSDLSWGDLDNDNDLDLIIIGKYGATTKIYRNDITVSNTKPEEPINLNSVINGKNVSLSWVNGIDNETLEMGISSNLYIYNDEGIVLSPMSDLVSGERKIVSIGNCSQNNQWKSDKLEAGKYYWSVQTIDNSFKASKFSSIDTFNIPFSSVFSIENDTFCEGEIVKIIYDGNAPSDAILNWDFDDGVVHSSSDFRTYYVSWLENGMKEIKLSVNFNGQNSDTTKVSVYTNSSPTATLYGDTVITEGETTNLYSDLTGTSPFNLTYSNGYFSNNILAEDYTAIIKIYAPNTYKLLNVIDAHGCSSGEINDTIVVESIPNDDTINNSNEIDSVVLAKEWQYGMLGNDLGEAGILVSDIDDNGINDIISTGKYSENSYFFTVLEYSEQEGRYITKWVSNIINGEIESIELLETNEGKELKIHLIDGSTLLYNTQTFEQISSENKSTFIQTGNLKSSKIDLPPDDATNFVYADLDNDNESEIIYSVGANCSCADYFFVYDSLSQAKEWQSLHFTGDFKAFDIGDIDNDNDLEIVSGVFGEYLKYYDHGFISVFDASNKILEFRNTEEFFSAFVDDFTAIKIGDINNDGKNEILLGVDNGYSYSFVVVFDSDFSIIGSFEINGMDMVLDIEIVDIDLDGQNELIVTSGTNVGGSSEPEEWQNFIHIYDGETGVLEFRSDKLAGIGSKISSLNVGNIDDDKALEIIALKNDSWNSKGELIIIDGISHELIFDNRFNYTALSIVDWNADNRFELFASIDTGKIVVMDGMLLDVIDEFNIGCGVVNAIVCQDLNMDDDFELVVSDKQRIYLYDIGQSKIFGKSDIINSNIGAYNSLKVGNFDLDENVEIFINGNHALFSYDLIDYSSVTSIVDKNNLTEIVQKISCYPNPFDDIINISFEINKTEKARIKIIDLNGQIFYNEQKMLLKGRNEYEINTSNLTNGTYVVVVQNRSEIIGISKIIKMK